MLLVTSCLSLEPPNMLLQQCFFFFNTVLLQGLTGLLFTSGVRKVRDGIQPNACDFLWVKIIFTLFPLTMNP